MLHGTGETVNGENAFEVVVARAIVYERVLGSSPGKVTEVGTQYASTLI